MSEGTLSAVGGSLGAEPSSSAEDPTRRQHSHEEYFYNSSINGDDSIVLSGCNIARDNMHSNKMARR